MILDRFIVDDIAAARAFVSGLPEELRQRRFSSATLAQIEAHWTPNHTVIALKDGAPVALADCIVAAGGRIGAGALVALEGCGAQAVEAWRHMRRLFPVPHMQATMAQPTERLVRLFAGLADSIYDQTTWDMAQQAWKADPSAQRVVPVPIAATRDNFRRYGLPRPSKWSETERRQISAAASRPGEVILVTKSAAVPPPVAVALAMEMFELDYPMRQEATRGLLAEALAAHFGRPAPATPDGLSRLRKKLRASQPSSAPAIGSLFRLQPFPRQT